MIDKRGAVDRQPVEVREAETGLLQGPIEAPLGYRMSARFFRPAEALFVRHRHDPAVDHQAAGGVSIADRKPAGQSEDTHHCSGVAAPRCYQRPRA